MEFWKASGKTCICSFKNRLQYFLEEVWKIKIYIGTVDNVAKEVKTWFQKFILIIIFSFISFIL